MEQEQIIQLAMNKSVDEINSMYQSIKDQKDILYEAIRQNISRTLMDTDYDHKMECDIILESDALGLSDFLKTSLSHAWQEPTDGTIWFNMKDCGLEINLDDIDLNDQITIVNELGKINDCGKILFVNDKSEAQRGVQLNDGRIISLFDNDNNFYLRYNWVIDLAKNTIIRKPDYNEDINEDEISKGYTTLNKLIAEKQARNVECYDKLDFDMDVYMDDHDLDKKVNEKKIIEFFRKNGYNVTREAVKWCFENWKAGFKSGYRDEKNGYHLFNPCGGNPLSIRLTTLNPLCEEWQTTYWC